MTLIKKSEGKKYVSIIEGSFRAKANEGEEGVIRREFENKKTGAKGVKFERKYDSLSGMIEKVSFKDSEYGLMIEIVIDGVTISTGTSGKYGSDIMQKLPELNLSEPVLFTPYNFVSEEGKQRSGMTIRQNDKKIPSFFHIKDGLKTKSINGFPLPEGDTSTYKKGDKRWTIFYSRVDLFLVDYTEKNIIPKIAIKENVKEIVKETPEESEFPEEELSAEETNLPF